MPAQDDFVSFEAYVHARKRGVGRWRKVTGDGDGDGDGDPDPYVALGGLVETEVGR